MAIAQIKASLLATLLTPPGFIWATPRETILQGVPQLVKKSPAERVKLYLPETSRKNHSQSIVISYKPTYIVGYHLVVWLFFFSEPLTWKEKSITMIKL